MTMTHATLKRLAPTLFDAAREAAHSDPRCEEGMDPAAWVEIYLEKVRELLGEAEADMERQRLSAA